MKIDKKDKQLADNDAYIQDLKKQNDVSILTE